MKIVNASLLASILFASFECFAATATCADLFNPTTAKAGATTSSDRSIHFMVAKDFFRQPVSATALKRDGRIVVSEPLLKTLKASDANEIRVYLVADARGVTPNQLKSVLNRHYGISLEVFRMLSVGFADVRLVGANRDVLRFLQNEFARRQVLSASLTAPKRFLEALTSTESEGPSESHQGYGPHFYEPGIRNSHRNYDVRTGNDGSTRGEEPHAGPDSRDGGI